MRTDKGYVFMRIAWELSALGTCNRKQVGALLVRDGRCISWGYNGAPPGMPHCDHTAEELASPYGCLNAIHAEVNAVLFAARQGIPTANGTLYVTCSPCRSCAQTLVAAGVKQVFYDEEYRDPAGRELLEAAGVACDILAL
jgi:dCMP deaminase